MMDTLERAVAGDGYITGERFSAADVYVGWGLQFGSIEDRPAFAVYWARIEGRDARRRANQSDDAAPR